ncbi:response regulator transcription factor [uncultured Selenomonas sp.]|uniref:response regulator transcription factor n=1 Tax=uncultured Selenomonas sp. TaxID=159275 RepID=UPI0025E14E14|nr:response regulator transcription factor [uncultured Selenomonas sp.]
MKQILIIEDNLEIAELERDFLEAADFAVTIAADGEQGLRELRKEHAAFSLVLLDIMLPGRDGFAICRDIRGQSEIPVLIVSAKGEDIDKIRGLGLGADDYITKPFSPSELVARVQSHIKRYERVRRSGAAEAAASPNEADSIHGMTVSISGNPKNTNAPSGAHDDIPAPHTHDIVHGALRIDTLGHRVFLAQKELALPNKEYELLTFLAEHPGIVFSKEQLFERVWGLDAVGDTATVMVHVNRIRSRIEADPAHPIYIETVWGAGYRFRG